MDATQVLVAGFGVLGTSGALVIIVNAAVKYFNGTAGRQRLRNMGMKEQRNEAWAEAKRADLRADREAHNRRLLEEYASQLRRDCTEHGVPDPELRAWPTLKKPTPEESA